MATRKLLTAVALCTVLAAALLSEGAHAARDLRLASYPTVKIINSTPYVAHGTVHYAACSSDGFTVAPNTQWHAGSRGLCLLTKIDAKITTPNGDVDVSPNYTSSGTSYSEFGIIQNPPTGYQMTRIVNS